MGDERQEHNAATRPRSPTELGTDKDARRWPLTRDWALLMQRMAGNRAMAHLADGDAVALAALGVQRQPVAEKRPRTRATIAEERLHQRWGVRTIRAGTIEEQASELIRYGTVPRTTPPADVQRM